MNQIEAEKYQAGIEDMYKNQLIDELFGDIFTEEELENYHYYRDKK